MAKTNNNVQGVLFLRNGVLHESREAARQGIVDNQNLVGDGQFILARYTDGNSAVKTLVGVKYQGEQGSHLTIIDVEGASADVQALREEINAKLGGGISSANTATAQLQALSGNSATDTSATTSVEGAKKYADQKISDAVGALDYTGITTGDGVYVANVVEADGVISATAATLPSVEAISDTGKPIIAVAEDKGTISATAGTINAEFVNIADADDKFSATTVEGALAELDDKITDVVDGLDYTDTAVTGNYVSKVDEVNGVISVTREPLPSKTDTAVAKNFVKSVSESLGEITVERGSISSTAETMVLTDNADGGVNFEVNIDNDTIVQDETTKKLKVSSAALTQYIGDEDTIHVSDVDANNEKTISSLLTIQKVTTGLSEEVKEEYRLVGASGTTIGDPVKIYKDSHIVSINYITTGEHAQNLEYVYIDASGNTQTTYVDMSELVLEAEFASGVTVTDHVAHGVVDPTSESFLTVGADGFKLAGVQDAIDSAFEGLDATVTGATSGNHITISIEELDGKLVQSGLTIEENDIASATALTQEIADREQGDEDLDERLGTGVTAENTATAQLAALSGNNLSTSADTSVEGAKRYADAKLADVVAGLDAVVSGESTHVNVEVSEVDGKITAVTVVEDNIADADDLAELSGKTITAITSENGSITATVNDAVGNKTANIETDASKIKMSGFTAAESGFTAITEGTSVTQAVKAIETEIIANEETTAAALSDLDARVDEISGISEVALSGVSVNGHAVTVANRVAPISISGSTATPSGTVDDPAIIVNTDANGVVTLGLGYIDCGTY